MSGSYGNAWVGFGRRTIGRPTGVVHAESEPPEYVRVSGATGDFGESDTGGTDVINGIYRLERFSEHHPRHLPLYLRASIGLDGCGKPVVGSWLIGAMDGQCAVQWADAAQPRSSSADASGRAHNS